ncbi:hypothetical protein GCM10007332_06890 [Epilithonimonas arachidiradicis]|uniref:Uncharacterized protein n=1 Tax=Epilithonimonas arachidiradicis TaxID=1617282 RepID=A0ABQ1WXG8_9FLAO|nr:hypothetical protein GCM10007332_06890 [Epilithonimonas arachidiradicis]
MYNIKELQEIAMYNYGRGSICKTLQDDVLSMLHLRNTNTLRKTMLLTNGIVRRSGWE